MVIVVTYYMTPQYDYSDISETDITTVTYLRQIRRQLHIGVWLQ